MNQELIESFVAVVNHQTISAAAKNLFVSQSTITHRIQVLEQELGISLFDRQRGFKRMELTESGKKLFPLAMQWLDLNSQMHDINLDSSMGKIRVGSMDSVNQFLLPSIVSEIMNDYPQLQMEFVSYHSQEIYNRLSSQQLDIGFAFYPFHYDIHASPVFAEPYYIVTPCSSIYPDGVLHPSQLKKSDEVLFNWDNNIIRWNNEWWDEHIPPFIKVDSTGLLSIFLASPTHWAVCPASVALYLQNTCSMKTHTIAVSSPKRTCYMLRHVKNVSANSAKNIVIFEESFRKHLETHPWKYDRYGK